MINKASAAAPGSAAGEKGLMKQSGLFVIVVNDTLRGPLMVTSATLKKSLPPQHASELNNWEPGDTLPDFVWQETYDFRYVCDMKSDEPYSMRKLTLDQVTNIEVLTLFVESGQFKARAFPDRHRCPDRISPYSYWSLAELAEQRLTEIEETRGQD